VKHDKTIIEEDGSAVSGRDKYKEWVLETDGTNLKQAVRIDAVNITCTCSNNCKSGSWDTWPLGMYTSVMTCEEMPTWKDHIICTCWMCKRMCGFMTQGRACQCDAHTHGQICSGYMKQFIGFCTQMVLW